MAIRELMFTKGWTPRTWGKELNWLGRTTRNIGIAERRSPLFTRTAGLLPTLGGAFLSFQAHMNVERIAPHLQGFNGADTVASVIAGASLAGILIVNAGKHIRITPRLVESTPAEKLGIFASKLPASDLARDFSAAVQATEWTRAFDLLSAHDFTQFGCPEDVHEDATKMVMDLMAKS